MLTNYNLLREQVANDKANHTLQETYPFTFQMNNHPKPTTYHLTPKRILTTRFDKVIADVPKLVRQPNPLNKARASSDEVITTLATKILLRGVCENSQVEKYCHDLITCDLDQPIGKTTKWLREFVAHQESNKQLARELLSTLNKCDRAGVGCVNVINDDYVNLKYSSLVVRKLLLSKINQ